MYTVVRNEPFVHAARGGLGVVCVHVGPVVPNARREEVWLLGLAESPAAAYRAVVRLLVAALPPAALAALRTLLSRLLL